MGDVILLSLTASLNPTLVAATTVMLLLDRPAKLMAGYLAGAYPEQGPNATPALRAACFVARAGDLD